MRVAVIGAGWFGCHIAERLIKQGRDVVVFEKSNSVFGGASCYNTGRLHLGFHYPRSAKTRAQSQAGFNLFLQTYPALIEDIDTNLYLVSAQNSIIDLGSYLSILSHEKYDYRLINPAEYGFTNMEGGLLCSEKAVNPVKAAGYFGAALKNNLRLNSKVETVVETGNQVVVDGEYFDYCINCSYYTFLPGGLSNEIAYETVIIPLAECTSRFKPKAFVIMDGDFFSLNPYFVSPEKIAYSIYHVTHSVVHSTTIYSEALEKEIALKKEPLNRQLDLDALGQQIHHYYPGFADEFNITGSFVSTRTKLVNNNANRECIVEQNGRTVNVLSGKVNSIFEAGDAVCSLLAI